MLKGKYKHLFFDLDHTLWDFDSNSVDTLVELFDNYQLDRFFDSFETFHHDYEKHNALLWNLYRQGKIKKEELNFERFHRPLAAAGCADVELAKKFGQDYLTISPTKTALLPHAIDVLNYLKAQYKLYIISNGFNEVQHRKIELCGIKEYFAKIYISDLLGIHKPNRDFFDYMIKSSNAKKKECLVIGDSLEADIEGALNAGIDAIFYNSRAIVHEKENILEISSLVELKNLL
ncbi:MAG: YjjG family noncanonical pyrimidine nucleotidase [Breznakibacter sp.]|nr:YjjG family noncanonical pyrimidine nucleotidase [Breznakibacter sp.]